MGQPLLSDCDGEIRCWEKEGTGLGNGVTWKWFSLEWIPHFLPSWAVLPKWKERAVSDKSVVEGGTLFSPRNTGKLWRPLQLEMLCRDHLFWLWELKQKKEKMWMFLPQRPLSSSHSSGLYFVAVLKRKVEKVQGKSDWCSIQAMTSLTLQAQNGFQLYHNSPWH